MVMWLCNYVRLVWLDSELALLVSANQSDIGIYRITIVYLIHTYIYIFIYTYIYIYIYIYARNGPTKPVHYKQVFVITEFVITKFHCTIYT